MHKLYIILNNYASIFYIFLLFTISLWNIYANLCKFTKFNIFTKFNKFSKFSKFTKFGKLQLVFPSVFTVGGFIFRFKAWNNKTANKAKGKYKPTCQNI